MKTTTTKMETRRFKKALETAVEQRRGFHTPGGFIIPEHLDREMGITACARCIAGKFNVTLEQACFALIAAMASMVK